MPSPHADWAAALGEPVVIVEPLPGGNFGAVSRLVTASGRAFVGRRLPPGSAGLVRRSVAVHDLLAKTAVPVPRVVWHRADDDEAAMVLSWVPGDPFAELPPVASETDQLARMLAG